MIKVKVLLSSCLLLLSMIAFSQKITTSFSVGYGGGLAKQDFDFSRTRTASTDVRQNEQYSLGKGLQVNGSIGFILSENLEAELAIGYLMGGKTQAIDLDSRDPLAIVKDEHTISGKMLSFAPGFVFRSNPMGSLQPYGKLAVVLASPTIKEDFYSSDAGNLSTFQATWKYNGGMATGFSGAAGVTFKMGKINLFSELFITSLAYSPKKGEMTVLTINGVDNLANLNVIDKQVIFVSTLDRNANIPNSSPDQVLKTYSPFSNSGLRVGVQLTF